MKKVIIMIIVALMAGFAIYQQFHNTSNDIDDVEIGDSIDYEQNESHSGGPLSIGQTAPNFELKKLNGGTTQLSDYKGKIVVLNFWATWCPPCRAEMPDLQKIYNNKNVEVLGVNLTQSETGKNNVAEFVKDLGVTFPILLDENSQIQDNYNINAYPTTYLIDEDGTIQYKALGAINYEIIQQELSKLE